ncbi:unnamed protein product [Owenia fusiformis]|uniref:Uncharacterized protein n=1 Tax=Owenia fusiformis TaxID=6347 RepID=A0A8J1TFM6_OWEFU|nr:unnamed protein product [Owenia fusiformis]
MEMFFAVVNSTLMCSIAAMRIKIITSKFAVGTSPIVSKISLGCVAFSILYGVTCAICSVSPSIFSNHQGSSNNSKLPNLIDDEDHVSVSAKVYRKNKLITEFCSVSFGILVPSIITVLVYVNIILISKRRIAVMEYSSPVIENVTLSITGRRNINIAPLELPVSSNASNYDRSSFQNNPTNNIHPHQAKNAINNLATPHVHEHGRRFGLDIGKLKRLSTKRKSRGRDCNLVRSGQIKLDGPTVLSIQGESTLARSTLNEEQSFRSRSTVTRCKNNPRYRHYRKAVERSIIIIVHVFLFNLLYVALRIAGVTQKSEVLRCFATYIFLVGITIMPITFGILGKERRDIIKETVKKTSDRLSRFFAIRNPTVIPETITYIATPGSTPALLLSTIGEQAVEEDLTSNGPITCESQAKSVRTLSVNEFKKTYNTKSSALGRISQSELMKRRFRFLFSDIGTTASSDNIVGHSSRSIASTIRSRSRQGSIESRYPHTPGSKSIMSCLTVTPNISTPSNALSPMTPTYALSPMTPTYVLSPFRTSPGLSFLGTEYIPPNAWSEKHLQTFVSNVKGSPSFNT